MSLLRGALLLAVSSLVAAGHAQGQPAGPGNAKPPSTASAPNGSAPAAESKGKPSASKAATPAVVVGLNTLESVTGKSVRSEAGEDMGRITDVLVDSSGQPRAAVIDFGGFLGVGSRKAAVDWKTLNFADSIKHGIVMVSLTRDQIRQSPEYKAGEPVVILEASKPNGAATPPKGPAAAPGH